LAHGILEQFFYIDLYKQYWYHWFYNKLNYKINASIYKKNEDNVIKRDIITTNKK